MRRVYEAERDNLRWLVDFLERLEREKERGFTPSVFTFTPNRAGRHLWPNARRQWLSRAARRRVTCDHIKMVDKLVAKIIGTDDPREVRKVNRTVNGQMLDLDLAREMGFEILTGGRNEALNLFFDHDVYNPWRPVRGWPLSEELKSPWVLVPQSPVLGAIGEHMPIPPGVPPEYTRGMRRMIWQDLSIPAMRRKFPHCYLEWREHNRQGMEKVWVFGWHEHTDDLYPRELARWKPSQREAVAKFVKWLNENFIGKRTLDGRLIAKYSNTDEVYEEFLRWERRHPGESSFNYPLRVGDWGRYPYMLKGGRGVDVLPPRRGNSRLSREGRPVSQIDQSRGPLLDISGRAPRGHGPHKDILPHLEREGKCQG